MIKSIEVKATGSEPTQRYSAIMTGSSGLVVAQRHGIIERRAAIALAEGWAVRFGFNGAVTINLKKGN